MTDDELEKAAEAWEERMGLKAFFSTDAFKAGAKWAMSRRLEDAIEKCWPTVEEINPDGFVFTDQQMLDRIKRKLKEKE